MSVAGVLAHEGPDMLVEFIFDYPSPYAYLASTQLGRLGVPVRSEPVGIVDVMRRVNNQPSPACPPKARYAGRVATAFPSSRTGRFWRRWERARSIIRS
jgi:2-hydroxychromene-2-carboxylate isomerase